MRISKVFNWITVVKIRIQQNKLHQGLILQRGYHKNHLTAN